MVAREDLLELLFAVIFRLLNRLSVIFQNVGKACAGQHIAPQVISFDAVLIGWVARTIVVALVEGQKP